MMHKFCLASLLLLLAGCSVHSTPVSSPSNFSDASRLTKIPISKIFQVPPSLERAESQLSQLVKEAASTNQTLSIAGARHSMGGQTAFPNCTVVDMTPLKHMEMLSDGTTLRVGAGAR